MKYFFTLIIFFATSNPSPAQTFYKTYSAGNNEAGRIFFEIDSGFILLNSVFLGLHDAELLRVAPNGDSLWQKYYPSGIFRYGISSIDKTLNGNFVTAKAIADTGINDSIIVYDIDKNGNVASRFSLTDTIDIGVGDIIQTRDSGFLICGSHWDDYGNFDAHSYLIKTDAAGNLQWKRSTSHSIFACEESNSNLTETSDNHYLVSIYSSFCSMTSPGFYTILRIDSLGNIVNSFSEQAYPIATPRSLIEKNGSSIYMELLDNSYLRYTKFDSIGSIQWQKDRPSYSPNYFTMCNSITDGFYMSGILSTTPYEAVITKFNDSGDSLYSFIYSGTGNLVPNYIDQLPDGRLALIGTQTTPLSSNGNPRQAFFLVADSMGNILTSSFPISKSDIHFEIFPNPLSDNLFISWSDKELIKSISIFNSFYQKQAINIEKFNNDLHIGINISSLSSGIYFLEAITAKQKIIKRFVKE